MEKDILECNENEVEETNKDTKWRIRYIQAFLLFFIEFTMTGMNMSLSISVLAMSNRSNYNSDVQTYDWDKEIHGYIFSSVVWGIIFVELIAGIAVSRYGSKILLLVAVFIHAMVFILIPTMASVAGWKGVCAMNAVEGVCQAFLNPSIYFFLGHSVPINERTRLGMIIFSGAYLGMVLTPPLAVFIGTSYLGWPWIYYCFGGQGLISGILWFLYGCKKEKSHIKVSSDTDTPNYPKKLPWKSIFTSVPFYALLCAQVGGNWGFSIIYNEMPSYFNLALGIDLKYCGFLTSLGHINALIFIWISTFTADYLLNKGRSLTLIRKLLNTIGSFGAASAFVSLIIIPAEYQTLMIVIVIICAGFDSVTCCGYYVNHVDLSPKFGSVLVGIANTITDVSALMTPLVSGFIIGDDTSNMTKWRYVFLIAACLYFTGSTIFLFFGSGEKQHWDDYDSRKSIDKDTNQVSVELLEKGRESDIKIN